MHDKLAKHLVFTHKTQAKDDNSLNITSFSSFLDVSNFGCRPETVGRKNGADFGFFGGSFGLFLSCKIKI